MLEEAVRSSIGSYETLRNRSLHGMSIRSPCFIAAMGFGGSLAMDEPSTSLQLAKVFDKKLKTRCLR